jgi:hypothetical protein
MFLMMLTGVILRRSSVLTESGFDVLNAISFKLLLPMSLFSNIYNGGSFEFSNVKMMIWSVVCHAIMLLILFAVVPRLFSENPVRASIIQSCYRSNFITFGLVIAAKFCKNDEIVIVSVLAGLMIPLYNIGAVAILEYYRGGRLSAGKMLRQVLKNPFVISCVTALLLVILNIRLPLCVESTVKGIAACATPISFIALGGCLNLNGIRAYGKAITFGVIWRLIVQPAIFLLLTWLMGFRGVEFLALTVMLISPTAVATYNMARSMDADGPLAGYLVVGQSLAAMFTIFVWIFFLNLAGII